MNMNMDDVTTVYKAQFLEDDKYYSMFQTFKNHVNDKGPELLVEAISKMNIKEKSLKVSTERARILKKTISLVIMHHHTMYGIHPALQAVYCIDGKSTSTCKIIIIEKYLFLEYLFPNGSVVKVLDF